LKRVLCILALMLTAVSAQAASLGKVDFSGFYQGRTTWGQDGSDSFKMGSFDTARARLKVVAKPTDRLSVTYQGDFATGATVTKDMFVTYLVMPDLSASFGQMVVPFGFEVTQSDLDRETPERALWSRTLFPGERDRGLKVSGQNGLVWWSAGIFNGMGANASDNDHKKDVSARAVVLVGSSARVGVSGWFGNDSRRVLTESGSRTRSTGDRKLGADVVVSSGPLTLTGEVVKARQYGVNPWGWDAQAALQVTRRNTLVAKFDTFDQNNIAVSKTGRVNTWNLGGIHQLDKNVKLKLFYTRTHEQFASTDNNGITAEVLANF
jgi:hypothetical protein